MIITDLFLRIISIFINPYSISRRFLANRGDVSVYQYGETPIASMDEIAKKCEISSHDRVIELGSALGRCSFFLAHCHKCRVVGVEQIAIFSKISNFLLWLLNCKNLKFINEDMFEIDFSEFDVVYLYGTCLKDIEVEKLINKFKKLKKGTKVITTSYGLDQYDKDLVVKKEFEVLFPWGKGSIFLHIL
jgi:hypothetical protein